MTIFESTETTGLAVKRRLLQNFAATSLAPAVSIVIQVVAVPIMLKGWGASLYGEWVLMSAIPAYLSMSDLGFASAAGNDMTMQAAAGDHSAAVQTFQSVSALLCALSICALALFVTAIYTLPLNAMVHITDLAESETRTILLFLGLYALLELLGGVISAGFRSDGRYAFSVMLSNGTRLSESGFSAAIVLGGATPVHAAATLLSCRMVGLLASVVFLMRGSPWLRFGFQYASLQRIRHLSLPALSMMAFPLSYALSFQGTVLVVGHVLGPVAVATFSTLRTLGRFAYQFVEQTKNSIWPELSIAFGKQDLALARKIHRGACQFALWASFAAAIALYFSGRLLYNAWTRHRVPFNKPTFTLLVILVVTGALWNISSIVAVAANRHKRVAAMYLAATTSSLILAVGLTHLWGITGTAASLFLVDFWMAAYVIPDSTRLVHDRVRPFLASLFDLSAVNPRILFSR